MISSLMSFFKHLKPVVVNCYTSDPSVFEYSKIDKATKFIPTWWKEIPNDTDFPTMKGCAGFLDQYKKSFIMPMWADFYVTLNEDGTFTWRFPNDETAHASCHPKFEYPNWIQDKSQHIKLKSPWFFHCDEDIYFQILPVQFSKSRLFDWQAVTGVNEYKYQHSSHINMFLNGNQGSEFVIEFGEPLAFFVPLTEKKVVFKCHLVSNDEMEKKQSIFPKITKNKYFASRKIKDSRTSKCPFGFGA